MTILVNYTVERKQALPQLPWVVLATKLVCMRMIAHTFTIVFLITPVILPFGINSSKLVIFQPLKFSMGQVVLQLPAPTQMLQLVSMVHPM